MRANTQRGGTYAVDVLWTMSRPTFTYIIEHFVQVGGVHDEVGVAHHVVYGVRLQSKREWGDVKVQFSHQVAVLLFFFFFFPSCLQNIFLSPTFSLAASLVSASIQLTYFRFSSKALLISPTIPSTCRGETDRGNSGKDFIFLFIYLFVFLSSQLTMALLSSVKVSLTNMAPSAKPRALSVSLTHSFQRGVQLCGQTNADTPADTGGAVLFFLPVPERMRLTHEKQHGGSRLAPGAVCWRNTESSLPTNSSRRKRLSVPLIETGTTAIELWLDGDFIFRRLWPKQEHRSQVPHLPPKKRCSILFLSPTWAVCQAYVSMID